MKSHVFLGVVVGMGIDGIKYTREGMDGFEWVEAVSEKAWVYIDVFYLVWSSL